MKCFEKKPDKNTAPAIEVNLKKKSHEHKNDAGIDEKYFLWLWSDKKILNPIIINKHLLKVAWKIKWRKTISFKEIPVKKTIKPSWERVEKATTFLSSFSKRAQTPPIIIVAAPNVIKIKKRSILNFSSSHTPAVTKVDEWTKELIGVGAAMAAGSQDENGNCALLEKDVVNTNNITISKDLVSHPLSHIIQILVKKNESPIRFIIIVFMEALKQ